MQFFFSTDRLLLKILSPTNANQVLNFYNKNKDFFETFEPERTQGFYTEPYHRANLSAEYESIAKHNYLRLWLFDKKNPDEIIGTICFSNMIRGAFQSCMVGYKIDFLHCNQGYASEALIYAIHEIIFKEYGFHRIEAYIHPANHPSLRLAEKLGFIYEGISRKSIKLNGLWEDHLQLSLINED